MSQPTPPEPIIVRVHIDPISAPLLRPWGETVREMHVIVVRVETSDGVSGTGFSWTPTIGATAIEALLRTDITSRVIGRSPDPEKLWDQLWQDLHEAGGGGLVTMAMAGIDLALWDRLARLSGQSIVGLLGARRPSVPVYGSGVNLHYTLDELLAQADRWMSVGFRAIKVKVGKPELAEDVERIAAVRHLIGPRTRLMLDANQRWDLPQARRAVTALTRFDLDWIEEPLPSDDLRAHAELRRSIDVPIAIGENLHSIYRFQEAIEVGACDIVQPNIVRVGGITPFRRIAELARTRSLQVAPHLLPELSGPLALTLTQETSVEWVEDAAFSELGLLAAPTGIRIADGRLTIGGESIGLGLTFGLDPGSDDDQETPAPASDDSKAVS